MYVSIKTCSWLVCTDKVTKNLHVALFANYDILFSDEDFGKVRFFGSEMGIHREDLHNINLDDDDFYEDDSEINIHVRLLAWRNKFEKRKSCKRDRSKRLIPVACYSTRW